MPAVRPSPPRGTLPAMFKPRLEWLLVFLPVAGVLEFSHADA